jgi:hypothetical protein
MNVYRKNSYIVFAIHYYDFPSRPSHIASDGHCLHIRDLSYKVKSTFESGDILFTRNHELSG